MRLDGAEERLVDLLEATRHADEWDELKRRYPRPALPSALATAKPDHTLPATRHGPDINWLSGDPKRTAPMLSSHPDVKAGRNDPCPCGSGKKHKKCCLARS